MTKNPKSQSPAEGDIVYFVQLHLNTLSKTEKHPLKQDEWVYKVEGKARPMLVWKVDANERGRQWFRVIPITTKGLREDGTSKPSHIRIGKLPGFSSESFAEVRVPQYLPDNMLDDYGGNCRRVCKLDRLAFGNVLNCARNLLMR